MKRLLAAFVCVSLSAPSLAQEISPGLWEITTTMKMQGMTMPAQKIIHCYTKKDIAAGRQYIPEENSQCKISNMRRSGGNIGYDMTCTAEDEKLTGSVKGTISANAFSLEQKLRVTPDQGMGVMLSIIKGRRLGDCK